MPAKSKAQQSAAAIALAAKRGERSISGLKGASKQMYEDMTEEELEDFASTKREGLPESVSESLTVTEPTQVVLDGQNYLLECGDKIRIIE